MGIVRHMKTVLTLLTYVTIFALAGCNGQSHNQADGEFAQGMIPHHQQAVEMSAQAQQQAGPRSGRWPSASKPHKAPRSPR